MGEKGEHDVVLRAPSLVVLCGISGSGKSTYAREHFLSTQVVSSDACRAQLADDPADLAVSGIAFELFHWIIGQRLRLERVVVADSTALTRRSRTLLAKLAKEHNAQAILVALDVDIAECIRRDALRDYSVGEQIVRSQDARFRKALVDVYAEDWDEIVIMKNEDPSNMRVRLGKFDLRNESGPFDIIGDLHGCTDELVELVGLLGYVLDDKGDISQPEGRKLVFLGDIADRGPHNAEAFALVMRWTRSGRALYTPGNHCNKLMRYLQGRRVSRSNGLDLTIADVEAKELVQPGFKAELQTFIAEAPPYLWLDGGSLIVAHAGIKARMIGRDDRAVQTMCLYGDIIGKSNPDGSPVRLDWAADYRGVPAVVYGHTPTLQAEWRNNTVNIDQGCVFGGWLTALRWPERETVQVQARRVYEPGKDMATGL